MLKNLSGAILSILIAVIAFMLSRLDPAFDSLVVSIVFGMLLSNVLARREALQKGIGIMLRFSLPAGIALYGTQLTLGANVSSKTLLSVIAVFVFSFATTFYLARLLRLSEKLSILIASGLAVCGASAIAIIAPLIHAKKEETSISVIVIMVVGLLSIIFYPLLWDWAGLAVRDSAFLSGTTIPMLGQVKITARTFGAEALGLAVKFKLVRIFMLLFLAIGLLMFSRRWDSSGAVDTQNAQGGECIKRTGDLNAMTGLHMPWFMFAFITFALLVNSVDAVASIAYIFTPVSSFLLSAALASVGLSVDFDSITSEGARPLLVAVSSWVFVTLLIYIGLRVLNV